MKSIGFNTSVLVLSLSIFLTIDMFDLLYLPVIPFGGFIITSIIFIGVHYLYVSREHKNKYKKNFFIYYFTGIGIYLLALTYCLSLLGLWSLFLNISEYNYIDIVTQIVSSIPSIITFYIFAILKAFILSAIVPSVFYGKPPTYNN